MSGAGRTNVMDDDYETPLQTRVRIQIDIAEGRRCARCHLLLLGSKGCDCSRLGHAATGRRGRGAALTLKLDGI